MLIDPVLERCAIELNEIEAAMRGLAFSRLADTTAWVHASWTLAQAQGALRRAQHAARPGGCELEAAAAAVRSARTALCALASLGPKSGTPAAAGQGDQRTGAAVVPAAYADTPAPGTMERVIPRD